RRADVLGASLLHHGGGGGDGDGGALVVADGGGVGRVAQAGGDVRGVAEVLQGQVDRLVAFEQAVVAYRQADILGGAGCCAATEGAGLRPEGAVVAAAGRRARARIDHVGGQGDARPPGDRLCPYATHFRSRRADVLGAARLHHGGGGGDGDGGALVVADRR